jgi:hypothetical protein
MKSVFLTLPVLALLGCGNPGEPGPLYPSYYLSFVDGKPLPVPFGSDGSTLISRSLGFANSIRPREAGPSTGTVSMTEHIRRPDQSISLLRTDYAYSIEEGVIRINLCPRDVLCIVATELVGPIVDRPGELVLTHYVGGKPGSVHRYFPVLLE